MKNNEIYRRIKGTGSICGCGKVLVPFIQNNQQVGVTHSSIEDEDFHLWFFTGRGYNLETNEYEEGFNPYPNQKPFKDLF